MAICDQYYEGVPEKFKQNESSQHYVLFSIKYYDNEKTVDKYDIQNIVEVMEYHNRSNALI